jgi:hypothetical protein
VSVVCVTVAGVNTGCSVHSVTSDFDILIWPPQRSLAPLYRKTYTVDLVSGSRAREETRLDRRAKVELPADVSPTS